MTVIFHVYLWHLVTLEQMNSMHVVMTHSIYQKRWRMPYIHSIGYKHKFSPNNKCCHIPVIWQVYVTTCHMTLAGICQWQTYTLSKLYGDSRSWWELLASGRLARTGSSFRRPRIANGPLFQWRSSEPRLLASHPVCQNHSIQVSALFCLQVYHLQCTCQMWGLAVHLYTGF